MKDSVVSYALIYHKVAGKLWYQVRHSLRSREEDRTFAVQTCAELPNTFAFCSPEAGLALRKGFCLSCLGLDQGLSHQVGQHNQCDHAHIMQIIVERMLTWPPFLKVHQGWHYSPSHLCVPKQNKPPTISKVSFIGIKDYLV